MARLELQRLASVVAAIAVAGTILGGSVTAVLAAKFSYRWFSAGLVNSHSLSAEQMQANYNAVIDYSLYPWVDELVIPHLPMSAAGAQHFAEAKDIFQIFVQGGLMALRRTRFRCRGNRRIVGCHYLSFK